MSDSLLVATGVEKAFGRTRALAGAGLEARRGEIHALLGANGAGKSTLARVISGHIRPDAAAIAYKGQPFLAANVRGALDAGVALVTQETSLAPDLSVLENIFLPEFGRRGWPRFAAMRRQAETVLARLGQEARLPLDREVRGLSAAQRQLVEIAKALALDADLIIFDEPTASLSPGEVEALFDIMTSLAAEQRALVFVSHRLEEVFAITDKVTVMREGRTVVASVPTRELTQPALIRHMVGQELGQIHAAGRASGGEQRVVLEVEHLRAPPLVRDVSFRLHAGEILGLGGLIGSGRSETLETLFGLRAMAGGTIRLDGGSFVPARPTDAIRRGIGFIPEDRRGQSIVPDFSVRENLLLAHLGAHRGFGLGFSRREARIAELLRLLDLPADRLLDANMLNFSGGMQQKVIIARWLLLEPRILMLDEPTKGVDIQTRRSIYAMLREVAEKGVAILVVSSDFDELLALCQSVVVISDGMTTAAVPSAMLDEEQLTLLAAPRSSHERTILFLRALTRDFGGAAFWGLVEGERFYCLQTIVADAAAHPGLEPGAGLPFAETRIAAALAARLDAGMGGGFVAEAEGGRATLLVEALSHRGHALGWIGLSLARQDGLPDAAAVAGRIRGFFATPIGEDEVRHGRAAG